MSNNPFLEQSAPAHTRFPDISSPGSQFSPSPSWQQQPSYTQQSYPLQQQPLYNGPMQPQATGWPGAGGGSGFMGSPAPMQTPMRTGFQPTSSFGQQMAAQMQTGTPYEQQPSYGGGGGGMGYQPTGMGGQWGGQQQQQQPNWNEIAQFDPYSQLDRLDTSSQTSGVGLFGSPTSPISQTPGGFGGGFPQPQQQQPQQQMGALNMPTPQPGAQQHPREFVQTHKRELEMWEPYAWKQLMNSFDGLKSAWETRKGEAEARARSLGQSVNYDYGAAQEFQRLQGVAKEAETNFDTTAAAAFQTLEVHQSYRQSGDLASKRRVKESINAALQSLPHLPPQQW